MQVCGVRSRRAILLTTAAGIAIGIELHLARQIWLWLRTRPLMEQVGLPDAWLTRYAAELSGGDAMSPQRSAGFG